MKGRNFTFGNITIAIGWFSGESFKLFAIEFLASHQTVCCGVFTFFFARKPGNLQFPG